MRVVDRKQGINKCWPNISNNNAAGTWHLDNCIIIARGLVACLKIMIMQ